MIYRPLFRQRLCSKEGLIFIALSCHLSFFLSLCLSFSCFPSFSGHLQSGVCPLVSPSCPPITRSCQAAASTSPAWQWARPCLMSSGCLTRRTWHRRMTCQWDGTFWNWTACMSQPTTPAWPWAVWASSRLCPKSLLNVSGNMLFSWIAQPFGAFKCLKQRKYIYFTIGITSHSLSHDTAPRSLLKEPGCIHNLV